MEFKTILEKRRSTRKFLPRKVEHDKLQRIIDMALQAPSSRNCRSTRLLVVEQPEILEKIAAMRDYGSAFVSGAAAVILVMGDRRVTDLWIDNCAITATVMQLAIVDEGLASCWVHVNGRPCRVKEPDGEQADEYLRKLLPIPDDYGILCAIAFGYSDFTPAPLPPYEGEERVKWL